jgi:UDP-glucose 4-epimerase
LGKKNKKNFKRQDLKYLITGGAGFLGSHLVEKLLNKKNKITILDNLSTGRKENIKNFKNINFIKCDLGKKGNWNKHFKNVDCVFHIAALADIVPSINNPVKYFESNVNGTLNVLEACKKNNVKRLIYTASSSCYGIPKKFPTKETEKINNQYPYALTKYLGEQLCLHWGKLFDIGVISLRLFNVYGTRSRTSGTYGAMFGVFLAQKLAKKPFTIVGNGNQTRDFTYVTDVVSALIKASKSKIKNEIFNIGSGKTVSVNRIAQLLKGPKVKIPKRPGEPDCTYANIKKIKKLLKWKPSITIEKGIKYLIKDISYWKQAPVWTPKKISKATKDWFKYLGK